MPPRMIVVAGPPGGGKSSIYPLARLGTRYFNADDRAAELNGGSYLGIPKQIRETVNREFEAFVSDCISQRESFAIETTLRSTVTFDQAKSARAAGFVTEMRYLTLANFAMHLERIKQRADAGGHSASEATLRRIYNSNRPRKSGKT
jgi:predicted ABC-type ATPase